MEILMLNFCTLFFFSFFSKQRWWMKFPKKKKKYLALTLSVHAHKGFLKTRAFPAQQQFNTPRSTYTHRDEKKKNCV